MVFLSMMKRNLLTARIIFLEFIFLSLYFF
jgi:hypothetical protein